MEFQIEYCAWTGRSALKVEIGAEFEGRSFGVRLGAAVKVAFASGADLSGAVLRGAVLSGADLSGADLSGAVLSGAVLRGAVKVDRILVIATRVNHSHDFILWRAQDGRALVTAGCRGPLTTERYRQHVAENYAGEEKGAETLRILDFFDATDKAFVHVPKTPSVYVGSKAGICVER